MCWNTYFIVFFEHQPKIAKKMAKNDNFWHFAKHRMIKKKPFCCNPPFDQKMSFFFFKFFVWKPKTFMLNRKHNLKSEKSKDKKKELERKKGRKLKKINDFRRKKLAI